MAADPYVIHGLVTSWYVGSSTQTAVEMNDQISVLWGLAWTPSNKLVFT